MRLSFVWLGLFLGVTIGGIVIGDVLGSLIGAIILVGGSLAFWAEWKAWSGGIGPSGGPWRSFDTDSSGAVGYHDGDGHTLWLSYFDGERYRTTEEEQADAIR